MNDLKSLYRDTVRRHANDPAGYRREIDATHHCEKLNPQCGDRVEIYLRVEQGRVADIAFDGEACALCMASASLMCGMLPGNPVDHLETLCSELGQALNSVDEPDPSSPLAPLYGVRPYPSRKQCVLLPWQTALDAVCQLAC
ncbi:MAG: iron-sulfur cluster assembly scaffold protein [Gammaproteobacteria bacterium]|nr:iron-sulfur cluster assembly scaffold protein [Gammaproteobacteria bacterium]